MDRERVWIVLRDIPFVEKAQEGKGVGLGFLRMSLMGSAVITLC